MSSFGFSTVADVSLMPAGELYRAGHYWSDSRYDHSIRDALIRTGNSEYLYKAGRTWPAERTAWPFSFVSRRTAA